MTRASRRTLLLLSSLTLLLSASCATKTTRSLSFRKLSGERIAVMPLSGPHGELAADLINQGLLECGFRVVERSRIDAVFAELGFVGDRRFDSSSLPRVGRVLGLREVVVGSISAVGGPLYSYPHANIALRVVDVETGEVLWASRYGNPFWSSAISTQGDVQRGAESLAENLCADFGAR
jgi:TolB-like protein